MIRQLAILTTLLLGAVLAGCSSRDGDRLSASEYPYAGSPYEEAGYDENTRYVGERNGARYAVETPRRHAPGGTNYYRRWYYDYGRDPSYDYYLASEDWWDGYDSEDYAAYDEYGGYDAYGGYPVEVAAFYDELDPYGTWYEDDTYGWVWSPDYVSVGWRPYVNGYWVYTDWGWTWVSSDPWGSDPYHYGRWYCDASSRWLWIPDDVWAPAWVSWRYGGGYVGWAALPPEASWDISFGLRYADHFVEPDLWCFVPENRFTDRRLRTYVAPFTRSRTLYRDTRDFTRYTTVNGRPAERGLRPAMIERRTGRDIPEYRLVTRERGLRRESLQGRTLYAPMRVTPRAESRRDAIRERGRQERGLDRGRERVERQDRVLDRGRSRVDRERVDRERVNRERVNRERVNRERLEQRERADRVQRGDRLQRGDRARQLREQRDERSLRERRERAEREDRAIQRQRAVEQQREERIQRDRGERIQRDRGERIQRDRGEPRMQRERSERIRRDRAEGVQRERAQLAQRERAQAERIQRDRAQRLQRDMEHRVQRDREERARYEQARQERVQERARNEQTRREQAEQTQARRQQAEQAQARRDEARQRQGRGEAVREERVNRDEQAEQERPTRDREKGERRGRGRDR